MKIDEVPSLARKSRIATHTHIKVCIDLLLIDSQCVRFGGVDDAGLID